MHAQLDMIVREFQEAQERLQRLALRFPDDLWAERPRPGRWSVSECVVHLNLTAQAFLPALRNGLSQARALGTGAPKRYRRDPLGWILWIGMGPPARIRTRTGERFVPSDPDAPVTIRAAFDSLQSEQVACARAADGLPLQQVRMTSPFDDRIRYNLYSALSLLPRHQHRHLWQAERAADAVAAKDG